MSVSSVSNITATSSISFQNAVEKGYERASKTLRGIQSMEILSEKAVVHNGEIAEYVVDLKVIFSLEN